MNANIKNQLKFYSLSFISIVFISFLVLYPSFKLAFQDEDWRGPAIWETEYVNSRLTSYIPPIWFFDSLYKWLGPNFSTYYILAFTFRNFLAFSILVFLYIKTKDHLASFLGGIFMVVSFTGLENTFLVINMIGYIAMSLLLIFLIAFFKTLDKFSFKHLSIMGISLLLGTFIVSVRVYPIYAWAFIVDGLGLLGSFRIDRIKGFLVRQLVILIVFLFLYKIGIFSWYSRDVVPGSTTGDLNRFVSDIISLLSSLNSNIILNFIRGLGNIIVPDILDKSGTVSLLLGFSYITALVILLIYLIKRRTRNIHLLFSFLFWPLFFYTSFFIVYLNSFTPKDAAIFHSNLRYQLPPFVGLCIALAILISLRKKIRGGGIILTFVILLILIHVGSTFSFLNNLAKIRDGAYMVKIWKQIKQLVPESSLNLEKMNVFYFETDAKDPSDRAIYTVNDGFIPHFLAVYKIDTKGAKFDSKELIDFNSRISPPLLTYGELVAYVKKSLSENPQPNIWDRIFTLRVEGDRVIDIKKDTRARVEEHLRK